MNEVHCFSGMICQRFLMTCNEVYLKKRELVDNSKSCTNCTFKVIALLRDFSSQCTKTFLKTTTAKHTRNKMEPIKDAYLSLSKEYLLFL